MALWPVYEWRLLTGLAVGPEATRAWVAVSFIAWPVAQWASAVQVLPTELRDGCAATLNTADELVFIFYRASVPASVVNQVKVLRRRQERPLSNVAWVVTRRPPSVVCRAAPARFVVAADGAGHVGVSYRKCGRNGRCDLCRGVS